MLGARCKQRAGRPCTFISLASLFSRYWEAHVYTRTPAVTEAMAFLLSPQSTLHSQSPHRIPSRKPDMTLGKRVRSKCFKQQQQQFTEILSRYVYQPNGIHQQIDIRTEKQCLCATAVRYYDAQLPGLYTKHQLSLSICTLNSVIYSTPRLTMYPVYTCNKNYYIYICLDQIQTGLCPRFLLFIALALANISLKVSSRYEVAKK